MELIDAGWTQAEVCEELGCDRSSLVRWCADYRQRGVKGLIARPASGRPRKLTARQEAQLLRMLTQGARAHGYTTDLWTTRRVADLVRKRFKVDYHHDHIGRILHRHNWSVQKPERRASERNEEAVQRWKRERWPKVKKTPDA
jgi:transposase